jgi:hypothetical protein
VETLVHLASLSSHHASAVAAAKGRRRKLFLNLLVIVCVGLVAFRLYLPTLILNKANAALAKIPGYYGHIDNIDMHLWRGAYAIEGVELLKQKGTAPVPFVRIESIDMSMAWIPLFHGNLSGKVELDRPSINFVSGGTPAEQQTSIDESWQDHVKELFPLRIARLGIKNGDIHFRNYHADPPVNIYIHKINLVATNLTNSKRFTNLLKATVDADAIAMTHGDLHLHMVVDPLGNGKTFEMQLELKDLALPELNDFFKHYLAVEVKDGTFSFYSEGAAKEGLFKGYAKPLLDHLNFIKIKENPSMGEFAKAIVAKFVGYVMKNHPKDRLATRIDMSGTVDKPDAHTWSAISSFLRNWLVHAISPGLEGSVHIHDVK